ncbi:MAG: hypothetical protein A3G80_05645 [Betaproteobacteria bacterium RIFCSPLOWO2_12_FULL_62_13b]|nr:MAG: hypothetical protein A3G80_05645 [Betaproteobacteria bacterium RIFCSPLOWO2_12_FULL_62_13b]
MTRVLAAALIFGLAACGKEAPPPPAVKPAPSVAAPEAKAPEAPKPDPSKALAARVKEALEGDSKLHAAGIDVTASGGVVALWGTVADAEERRRAAQVAGSVEGVKSVDNKLTIVKGS